MAMSREEVDRALARLSSEREAIESSLLALQDHSGRRLLEGAELSGVTKERWSAAEQAVSLLWAHFETYTDALTEARELRSRRSRPTPTELAELSELLTGSGVTVSGGQLPDDAQLLTGPARLTEQLSLDKLVKRMNGWYAEVIEVVSAADAVWSALPARIDLLTAEVQRVRALARSVGVRPGEHPAGDGLEEITHELAALRDEVLVDPLAFWQPSTSAPGGTFSGRSGIPDTSRYDRAARALEEARREIESVLQVRDDADERLHRVHDVLARADATLTEARSARGEVLAKIAASEVPVVSRPAIGLRERVSAAVEYLRTGNWHRLAVLLDVLEEGADDELARARESLTAVTAPLAVRAELRGRLDAYKAKVARLGHSEDPELLERYDQARRLLWSAPCDLRAADHAVQRYQQAVASALAFAQQMQRPHPADQPPRRGAAPGETNHWGRA